MTRAGARVRGNLRRALGNRTHIIVAGGSVSDPPRPDGYPPLAMGLMLWRGITGFPQDERFWFLASAARRLDIAHRQLERARDAIDAYSGDPSESLVVLGDVELALVAMHRAIAMAAGVNRKFGTGVTFPAAVEQKREAIKMLRDAYEHIDDRALGFIKIGVANPAEAHTLFAEGGYGKSLIERREVAYRGWTLGVDQEATQLLTATAEFLRAAWVEMCDLESAERAGPPGDD